MGSPSVIHRDDPRARALLGVCLLLCCGFFVAEMVAYLVLREHLPGSGAVLLLESRQALFALGKGNLVVGTAAGLLLHAGMAALMSAALQHTWLRSRSLALSIVLLIFVAFQGGVVALAVGKS